MDEVIQLEKFLQEIAGLNTTLEQMDLEDLLRLNFSLWGDPKVDHEHEIAQKIKELNASYDQAHLTAMLEDLKSKTKQNLVDLSQMVRNQIDELKGAQPHMNVFQQQLDQGKSENERIDQMLENIDNDLRSLQE